MASAFIVKLSRRDGVRYQVRYRLGGRESQVRYAGHFRTHREAKTRRDKVLGDLAAGRVPSFDSLEPAAPRTVAQVADQLIGDLEGAGRSVKTVRVYRQAANRLGKLGHVDITAVTVRDVQDWINSRGVDDTTPGQTARAMTPLAPASLRKYLDVIRQTFDIAEVTPNPARSRQLRVPELPAEEINPPTFDHVTAILDNVTRKHWLPVVALDWTGLRIEEAHDLRWGDIDWHGGRLRIAAERTKGGTAGRRFVPVPGWLLDELGRTTPWDDRDSDSRVLDFTVRGLAAAITRACKAAGVPPYTPHDFRHRYISVLVMAGTPVTVVKEVAGHSRASMTLDRYSHVMFDEPAASLQVRRLIAERRDVTAEEAGKVAPRGVLGGVLDAPHAEETTGLAGDS